MVGEPEEGVPHGGIIQVIRASLNHQDGQVGILIAEPRGQNGAGSTTYKPGKRESRSQYLGVSAHRVCSLLGSISNENERTACDDDVHLLEAVVELIAEATHIVVNRLSIFVDSGRPAGKEVNGEKSTKEQLPRSQREILYLNPNACLLKKAPHQIKMLEITFFQWQARPSPNWTYPSGLYSVHTVPLLLEGYYASTYIQGDADAVFKPTFRMQEAEWQPTRILLHLRSSLDAHANRHHYR